MNHRSAASMTLLTDLYQLTMAYGYWKTGIASRESVFHLTYRRAPFAGEFAIACGLSAAIDWLSGFGFSEDDCRYLGTLCGADGKPLFPQEFLNYLQAMKFECDIDAIPEGVLAFPHEPLIRVQGPMVQCQIIETALLNLVNFQTLIATKSARVCGEAKGDAVLEFGLRRAQGVDGALAASRAAYIGGCAATSNVLAGRLYDIPVKGTHAHSWVMSFDTEIESFRAYAAAMPNNCVFLVDTYDTLEGVRNAIEVGKELRQQGYEMTGVRLDSGDLAELSIGARKLLDAEGFPQAAIVASNDLDEHLVRELKQQGATINVWGIGTRLATAFDQPALGGVYKLAATRDADGQPWQYRIKLSEQKIKISNPGIQQVRRYKHEGYFTGDAIYNLPSGIESNPVLVHNAEPPTFQPLADSYEDLLQPVFRGGELIYKPPTASQARTVAQQQLAQLAPATRRLSNPAPYPVGLESKLHAIKTDLIERARLK